MTLWLIFYHWVYLQETEIEFQSHLLNVFDRNYLTAFISGFNDLNKSSIG